MNRKGFMMAELIVVSSIVLLTMVGMYTGYNKIHSTYETRISYYDVATLYRLGYYRDVLKEYKVNDSTTKLDETKNNAKSNKIVEIYNSIDKINYDYIPNDDKINGVADRVFMIYNNKNSIDSSIFNGKYTVHVTFSEYLNYLSGRVDNYDEFSYMMIMERCNILDNGKIDENNCNYAYLEIFD